VVEWLGCEVQDAKVRSLDGLLDSGRFALLRVTTPTHPRGLDALLAYTYGRLESLYHPTFECQLFPTCSLPAELDSYWLLLIDISLDTGLGVLVRELQDGTRSGSRAQDAQS
jgi:hypothetical protein